MRILHFYHLRYLAPVEVVVDSLDPRYTFIIDTSEKIWLWFGRKSKNTLKSKSRLFAEKINKNERKGKMEICVENQGEESEEFAQLFEIENVADIKPSEYVDEDFKPPQPT